MLGVRLRGHVAVGFAAAADLFSEYLVRCRLRPACPSRPGTVPWGCFQIAFRQKASLQRMALAVNSIVILLILRYCSEVTTIAVDTAWDTVIRHDS